MWAVFIGAGLGALQVLLLRKVAGWITSNQTSGTMMAVFITIIKLGVILGVLFLLALVSIETLLWAAGGMLAVMIGLPVYMNIRQNKKIKEGEK
jgi:hypothetical protein